MLAITLASTMLSEMTEPMAGAADIKSCNKPEFLLQGLVNKYLRGNDIFHKFV